MSIKVEKMLGLFGSFVADGERGAKCLELVIPELPPDLLANLVITNMKNLPKNPPPLRISSFPEISSCARLSLDSKLRDSRKDPRRQTTVVVEVSPPLVAEHNNTSAMLQSAEINPSSSSNIDIAVPKMPKAAYPKMYGNRSYHH